MTLAIRGVATAEDEPPKYHRYEKIAYRYYRETILLANELRVLQLEVGRAGPARDQKGSVGSGQSAQGLPHRGGKTRRLEPAGDGIDDPGGISRGEAWAYRHGYVRGPGLSNKK